MKRLLCILLVLCALPFCLISCKKDEIPETVEAKYPVIEGRRIPFRYLFTSAVKNCGDHFVLRSTKEVEQAFEKDFLYDEFYDGSSIEDELKEFLMEIDYDKYQVLGVTTAAYKDVTNVVELIERDGELCAVFESDYVPPDPDAPRKDFPDVIYNYFYTTVILVRKGDLDLSHWEKPFNLDVTGYGCYKNLPETYSRLKAGRGWGGPPTYH